jgi:hypothetical protein
VTNLDTFCSNPLKLVALFAPSALAGAKRA